MRGIGLALVVALLPIGGMAQAAVSEAEPPAPVAFEPERVVVRVNVATQQMEVFHEGRRLFVWTVSTARAGKITPAGVWQGAQALSRNHRSRLYHGAPMPFAIFFNGNYAIHGTDQIKKLGTPASAGCVRLHPDNAKVLFEMVKAEGMENFRVEVVR